MTPEGEVAVARTLDNNVAMDNDDNDGEDGEAPMAREEEEGEEAEEEERWYKLGRFRDALRSYADRLACIVEDKLRNGDKDNDNRNVASGDERLRRPSLLPIQSQPSSSPLNFIMDKLIPLFIFCYHYCQICGRASCPPPQRACGSCGGGGSGEWWQRPEKTRGEEKGDTHGRAQHIILHTFLYDRGK